VKAIRLLLALSVAIGAALQTAAACDCGPEIPEYIQVESTQLVLNGLAELEIKPYRSGVYVAALYVPKASSDAARILEPGNAKQIVLDFLREVSANDLRRAWTQGIGRNAHATLPALQDRIATLNGWMVDIKINQRIKFTYLPAKGLEVSVNGIDKGTIRGEDFAKALFAIWLGNPLDEETKSDLLQGRSCPGLMSLGQDGSSD
jgi:hypothetical protein